MTPGSLRLALSRQEATESGHRTTPSSPIWRTMCSAFQVKAIVSAAATARPRPAFMAPLICKPHNSFELRAVTEASAIGRAPSVRFGRYSSPGSVPRSWLLWHHTSSDGASAETALVLATLGISASAGADKPMPPPPLRPGVWKEAPDERVADSGLAQPCDLGFRILAQPCLTQRSNPQKLVHFAISGNEAKQLKLFETWKRRDGSQRRDLGDLSGRVPARQR
jgi:hypothetical protein